MMRKTPLLKTISFVLAVCAVGFFTSCDASWNSLDMIGKMVGIDLKQASGGCGCNCLGTKGTVHVANDLNKSILGLFITASDNPEWGENFLTEALLPGAFFEASLEEGLWDVGAVDEDSNTRFRYEVLVTANETININISELTLYTEEEDFVFDDTKPTGPPTSVPDVVGMTQSNAKSTITSAGFVVGSTTTQFSNAVAAGNVSSQMPVAGTVIPGGSMISIVVAVAEDFSYPELETALAAEDVRWEDYPDVAQESAAISDTVETFTDALREGDVETAVLQIYSSKRAAYQELFESRPEAMESFANLLSGITMSFLGGDDAYIGKQTEDISPERYAEYKVILDGHTFYVTFMKVDGSWVLYDF